MRRLTAALVLGFPVCASAQLVQVEYEGVVDLVTRTVCVCDPTRDYAPDHPEFTGYSVGDRIRGFLTIDLAAAPPDIRPLDPTHGAYQAAPRSGGYISGNGDPLIHRVINDTVSVRDRGGDVSLETYSIDDQWSTPNGFGQMGINLWSRDPALDLVTGDGIAQAIDARPSAALRVFGHLHKVVRSGTSSVVVTLGLLFDRVTVTPPGSCKA
jgi:hypothetical protein